MQFHTVRRFGAGVAAGAALMTAACKDARLDNLAIGISRDSALAIINEGAGGDSLARVWRQETYLLPNRKGRSQLTNILFYNKRGVKESDDPNLSADDTTPIVVSDGKVIGWGWTYYDSVAKANNIPVRAR